MSDLRVMLQTMQPVLAPQHYGIVTCATLPAGLTPFATVAEVEGLTVIATLDALSAIGVAADASWALISLTLHSDLQAVGLTAAFAKALTDEGISANVIAGYYHDHILVQWDKADLAMKALQDLARA